MDVGLTPAEVDQVGGRVCKHVKCDVYVCVRVPVNMRCTLAWRQRWWTRRGGVFVCMCVMYDYLCESALCVSVCVQYDRVFDFLHVL